MNAYLLALVGLIYAVVAWKHSATKRFGMALTFIGYAIANVGLILDGMDI